MTPEEKDAEVKRISTALADFFDRAEVKFKPAVVSGNRAMALAYVDARVIQDRLDEVLGTVGWQDDYEIVADGSVVCRLKLLIAGEWMTKVDVGSQSEQTDGGDRLKAAFSDALKRAAVKFGIGRYLYRLPAQWVDYDVQRRQFVKPPALPDWAGGSGKADQPATVPAKKQEQCRQPAPSAAQTAQDRKDLEAAAQKGSTVMAAAWKALGAARQHALANVRESLKAKAAEVDRARPA